MTKLLLCSVGWHTAQLPFQRNRNYHFTRCSTCGCDLVRSAATSWHRPRGYRVVWPAAPPVVESPALRELEREPPAPAATEFIPPPDPPAEPAEESGKRAAAQASVSDGAWPYPATGDKLARTGEESAARQDEAIARSAMELLHILGGVRKTVIALPDLSVAEEHGSTDSCEAAPSEPCETAELLSADSGETTGPPPMDEQSCSDEPGASAFEDFMGSEVVDEFHWEAFIGLNYSGRNPSLPKGA